MRDTCLGIHKAAANSIQAAFPSSHAETCKLNKAATRRASAAEEAAALLKRADSASVLSVTSSNSSLAAPDKQTRQSAANCRVEWWRDPAKLYTFNEIPLHLQDNKYILTGYRAFYTYAECLRSVFRWHNESINIWSHWISAVVFIALAGAAIQWQAATDAENGIAAFATMADRLVMTLYLTSAFVCLFCSGMFHTFYCHSHTEVYDKMAITDFTGISLLISGSFTSLLYFAVRPKLDILPIPMGIVGLASLTGAVLPWFPFFRSHQYRILRTKIFFAIAATFSLTVTWAVAQVWEEVLREWQWSWVLWLGGVVLCYGGGAIIYATRFPECLLPGKFDNIGASHQLWHLLVIAGAACQWRLLVAIRDWRFSQDLAASLQ